MRAFKNSSLLLKIGNLLFDNSFSDAVQATLWFVLPGLYIFKFASLFYFWCWLFITLFCLSYAFSYHVRNPGHKYGSLYKGALVAGVGALSKNKKVK